MDTYICTGKERDRNNNIKKYFLKNVNTQECITASSDRVKALMSNNQIKVTNLQIDKAGRLQDCSPQNNTADAPKRLSDMTNSELFRHIEEMNNNDKASREQLIKLIKELCRRYTITDNKVNQILQQIQAQDTQNQSPPSLSNQMSDIMSYLLDNRDNLQQINNSISSLTSQLNNIGSRNATTDDNNTLLSADGHFDMPEDPYSNYFYKKYFTSTVDNSAINLNANLLDLFKVEIEKAYKAYTETRSFYIAQLSDYTKNLQTSLFTEIMNVASEKAMSTIGAPVEITGKAFSELKYFIAKQIPSMERQADVKKVQKEFGNKPEISKEQAQSIMKLIGGLWNNAISFIENNEEWEIMLYVIQTLNHTNLKTYKISNNYMAIESQNGQMIKKIDDSITNKKANSLTENSLKAIYEYISGDISCIKDKTFECAEQVYDRFIVSYFASKKVLYQYQLYPFNESTPQVTKVNGLLVKLLEIGLKLSNVQEYIIKLYIERFSTYNNNRGYEYRINMNVDIGDFIPTS